MDTIDKLFEIIRTLRSENGCPWDSEQTPATMWKYLIEESYELEEAIAKNDLQNVCEELGDVLFQIIFIMEIFQEKKAFTFEDVVGTVARKMIRRHPHVYKDADINTEEELFQQWEAIKAEEKSENGIRHESVLDSVPKGMPALIRASKVSKCVVRQGFDWDDIHGVLKTVRDEIDEFEEAIKSGDQKEASLEFGDILFSLVNVARFAKVYPETALADSTAKFEERYRLMEEMLKKKGALLKDLPRGEVDQLWDTAKKNYDK